MVSEGELHAENEALAAELREEAGEAALEGVVEEGGEEGGFGGNGGEDGGIGGEAGEDVVRDAAREGVAAEGGAVVAGFDVGAYRGAGDEGGADGDAVAEGFGGGEDVWVGGGVVSVEVVAVGPEFAGAGEAALDFVEDEQSGVAVAVIAEGVEEFRGGDVDAAFALDGLDDHAAGLRGDEAGEGFDVVEMAVLEAGEHGAEGSLVFFVGSGGEGAVGAAVKTVVEGENFTLFGGGIFGICDFPGKFEGGFVGF